MIFHIIRTQLSSAYCLKSIGVFLFVLVSLLSIDPDGLAQGFVIPKLNQAEIADHLMIYVAPVYPAIAEAAKVEGNVVVSIEIGPDGLVRSARAVSGPKMLRQVASDAVRHWRYQPFHEGASSITVTGDALVSFSLHDQPDVHTPHEATANGSYSTTVTFLPPDNRGQPDEALANRFFPLWEVCSRGVIAHAVSSEIAITCKTAASVADEFPQDRRFTERRQVYVYTAIAFVNVHEIETAIPYANRAVEVVKLGHDDSSGREAAYSIRGQVRAFSGDLEGGDQDMSIAEEAARQADNPRLLKSDLQFHGELLNRMNRPKEAQVKMDEAAKL